MKIFQINKYLNKMNPIKFLMIAGVLIACSQKPEKQQDHQRKSVPVKVTKVEHRKMMLPVTSQGKLSSGEESQLSFKTGGIVQDIMVDEGQQVRKGEILARLDQSEIKAQYKQAKVSLDKARRDYERMQRLYKDKVVTLETLQNAETAYEVAQSDLSIAQFNLQHATITAPAGGEILQCYKEENELVDPGVPVFTFGNTHHAWIIKAGIVDKDLINIKLGDSAKVIFDALPRQLFQATVSLIPNSPNPMNGTYEVELAVKSPSGLLKKGFYAKVHIYPSRNREYQVIPMTSLVEGQGREGYVFVPKEGKAKKQKVYVSDFLGDRLVVHTGLEKVTSVVVEGAMELTEGSSIQIVN